MTEKTAEIQRLATGGAGTETLLTFILAGQTFGVSVGMVSEIIDPQKTTRVPNADALAPSLINVRGSIVPVIDLRYRLGMRPAEQQHTSRMLVLDMIHEDVSTRLAVMADEVKDVIEITIDEIDTLPHLGITWPADCFRGVTMRGETLIILVNAENAFSMAA